MAPAPVAGVRPAAAFSTVPAGPRTAPPAAAPLPAPAGTTSLISRARSGASGDYFSLGPAISDNGRWIAFASAATDLVSGDVNGATEVFLRDRKNGTTIRLPLVNGMVPTGGQATEPAIAADGSVVAFTVQASSFSTVGTAGTYVMAWTRKTGKTVIVSRGLKGKAMAGAREPSVSGDGRYIAYTSIGDVTGENDGADDVFRFDMQTGITDQVSVGPEGFSIAGAADSPSISADGSLVAFVSDGLDTVVHANTGKGRQVYVRNMNTGTNEAVSLAADGGPASDEAGDPAISGDGRYVAFTSQAVNLVFGAAAGSGGVFRRDRLGGFTEMVSVNPEGLPSAGTSGQASITADGGMVAFASTGPDLVAANQGGIELAASARVPVDVFLRDMTAGQTVLISVDRDGNPSSVTGTHSIFPAVAAGGRYTAFASDSDVMAGTDSNESYDVFLRDLPPDPRFTPELLDLGARAVGTESLPAAGVLANAGWSPLLVTGATITGTDKGDFRIVSDACAGRSLKRGEACTVSVVFAPIAKGTRSAVLEVADAYTGSPRTLRLRGRASQAKLVLDPPIGAPGIVTVAKGSGFPAGSIVHLHWSTGITPHIADVTADAKGRFRVQVLVFHGDVTGPRELLADPAPGQSFPGAAASMLVVKASEIPPAFGIIRFIDLPLVLVFRG